MKSTSVLFYGPEGCGKTMFASATLNEVSDAVNGVSLSTTLDAPKLLEQPNRIENVFKVIEQHPIHGLLIDDIDDLLIGLRSFPGPYRYLLDRIKSRSGELLIVATARKPDSLLPGEIEAFENRIPLFYPDKQGRIDILRKLTRDIRLEHSITLDEIAQLTEWWSYAEIKRLVDSSSNQDKISRDTIFEKVQFISDKIAPDQRINRTRDLVRFTSKYCTSNELRSETLKRFSGLLHTPAHKVEEDEFGRIEQKGRKASLPRRLRVFLCHSSGDKPAVHELYRRLQEDWIEPWLDEENLLPGQNWQKEITKAVRVSDVVIVCLSESSITKEGFVQKEIKLALDVADEKPEGTIFIIPLRLEECEIPDRLSHCQWVNFFQEKGYEKLMRSLRARANAIGVVSE